MGCRAAGPIWAGEGATALRPLVFSPARSITVLGTGAKWLAVLEEKGLKPGEFAGTPSPVSRGRAWC